MSKANCIFRIILRTIGIGIAVFGILALTLELTSEKHDTFGIILASIFIFLGIVPVLLSLKKRKPSLPFTPTLTADSSEKPEKPHGTNAILSDNTASQTYSSSSVASPLFQEPDTPSWIRTCVTVSAIIETILTGIMIIALLTIGIAGINAGEMDAILGFLCIFALIPIALYLPIRLIALRAIYRNKRWGAKATAILMLTATLLNIIALSPIALYTGFITWCSYRLSKSPKLL